MMSVQNPHPGDRHHGQIPVGCPTPPPLGLDIDRCIIYTAGDSNPFISHVPAVVLSKKYLRLTSVSAQIGRKTKFQPLRNPLRQYLRCEKVLKQIKGAKILADVRSLSQIL